MMTEAQREAIKPWAIVAVTSRVVNLLVLTGAIIYVQTGHSIDHRLFALVCVCSLLISRAIWRYYAYRAAKIMGTPERDTRAILWPRSEILIILLVLILTVAQYW